MLMRSALVMAFRVASVMAAPWLPPSPARPRPAPTRGANGREA